MLNIKIPQKELQKRALKLLQRDGKNAVVVIWVSATMGGKLYHVAYNDLRMYGAKSAASVTYSIWEIIDAQDFYGSTEERLLSIPEEKRAALDALGLTEMPETLSELKKTFRKLAKTHHPDLGGDINEFRFVEGAYRLLTRHFESLELV